MVQTSDSGKIQVLEERVEHLAQMVQKHDVQMGRLAEQVSGLSQTVTETKVYVTQIFTMLEDIKTQLRVLGERTERHGAQDSNRWIDFLKQFMFVAVGALVTYLMTKK
jgi:uncharacterized protein YukE